MEKLTLYAYQWTCPAINLIDSYGDFFQDIFFYVGCNIVIKVIKCDLVPYSQSLEIKGLHSTRYTNTHFILFTLNTLLCHFIVHLFIKIWHVLILLKSLTFYGFFAEISKTPAFTATVRQLMTSQNGQTLVFPHIVTNVGGGYNGNTGVFTTARYGVYAFFCKITGRDNPD